MHTPVLAETVLRIFQNIDQPNVLLDGTFGRGGHTHLLKNYFPKASILAFDKDPEAIHWGRTCKDFENVNLYHACFSDFDTYTPKKFSGILLDLGVSSPQLDTPERGFSFRLEGPLDMRMSQCGPTAKDILQTYSEQELSELFWTYGQERHARFFAKIIKEDIKDLHATTDLAQLIYRVSRKKASRAHTIHPATRVFQALRIAVNQELEILFRALPKMIAALEPGGILIVISFQSLEDGIVKRAMRACCSTLYTCSKKPLIPSDLEIDENPRARSAKLRWIQRCKDQL